MCVCICCKCVSVKAENRFFSPVRRLSILMPVNKGVCEAKKRKENKAWTDTSDVAQCQTGNPSLCRHLRLLPHLPPALVSHIPLSFPHPFSPLIGLYFTQFSFFNTIYPPLSALHAFTLPSNTSSPNILPLSLHKNGDNSRGKFIRSKNKRISVSVLLSWHVPQGCSVLWMALSAHFVWGAVYMLAHLREAHTPFPKDAQKAVITSIPQHCYCCYPLSRQSGLGPFLQ